MSNKEQERYSIQEDKPAEWFEPLYAGANVEGDGVPWANMATHPLLEQWLQQHPLEGVGKRALVVGCGMGDDAIALEQLGFQVTAFDVADSAIKFCQERFPQSAVEFVQADLLVPQTHWQSQFDFVLEIYTVQALPPKFEQELIESIASFVAPEGQLLVVAEVVDSDRTFENGPPWLLTPSHVDAFVACGLRVSHRQVEEGALEQEVGSTYVTAFTSTQTEQR